MRMWCAHCKRVQQVIERRRRRRRTLERLAGRVGVCAVCHYPVSAIGYRAPAPGTAYAASGGMVGVASGGMVGLASGALTAR